MVSAAELDVAVGNVVARLRRQSGYSQEELADRSNLHRTYISQLERGKKSPSIRTMYKISEALHISMSKFFSELEK